MTDNPKVEALQLMLNKACEELGQYKKQEGAMKAALKDIQQSIKELEALIRTHKEELKRLT